MPAPSELFDEQVLLRTGHPWAPPGNPASPAPDRSGGDRNEPPPVWGTVADAPGGLALAPEWLDLAGANQAALFRTPQWVLNWLETIGRDVEPRILTQRDRRDRLVGLWAMGLLRRSRAGLTWRVMEPMGDTLASGDRLEALAGRPGLAEQAVGQVRCAAAEAGADIICWRAIDASSPIAALLTDQAAAARMRLLQRETLPVAALPAGWDAYESMLTPKLRSYLRRQERLAAERFGLRWRLNDEDGPLEETLEAFFDLHGRRWSLRGRTGNYVRPQLVEFVRRFALDAHRQGWLRLHRLCDGTRTVAALLAFHFRRRACYYQSGWDPDAATLSPGSLCIARAIRTAIQEGMTAFDFLRGDEPYKRRWADRREYTITLAEPLTAKGEMVLRAGDARHSLRRCWDRLVGGRTHGRTGDEDPSGRDS